MRERQGEFEHIEIKEELNKFINLLQSDYKATPHDSRNEQYTLSKKLSVILSASEPESSSLDKENSNPSANRSFDTNDKPAPFPLDAPEHPLLHALIATGLTQSQLKLVDRLREAMEELRVEAAGSAGLRAELGAEKRANDEMLSVLMRLDRQEKELWSSYNALSGKYQEVAEKNKFIEGEFQLMKDSLTAAQNDNDFMKRLIFHANENYELLERKYLDLEALRERSEANTDRRNLSKLSTDNLLKSAKTRKKGHSPSHSEAVQHSPSVENFEEVYQKMILRTLKFKGKQNHIR